MNGMCVCLHASDSVFFVCFYCLITLIHLCITDRKVTRDVHGIQVLPTFEICHMLAAHSLDAGTTSYSRP